MLQNEKKKKKKKMAYFLFFDYSLLTILLQFFASEYI